MDMAFCRRCGGPFASNEGHIFTCANGHTIYANASPAVGLILETHDEKIVALRRKHEPFKGGLDLPGGFCDGAEPFEIALEREINEELGLAGVHYSKPTFILSDIDHYIYGGETIEVLCAVFYARLFDLSPPLVAHDDAAEIEYLRPDSSLYRGLSFNSLRAATQVFAKQSEYVRKINALTV